MVSAPIFDTRGGRISDLIPISLQNGIFLPKLRATFDYALFYSPLTVFSKLQEQRPTSHPQ